MPVFLKELELAHAVADSFEDNLLQKDVAKERISSRDADATRSRISTSTSIEKLGEVDFVIEAVPVKTISFREDLTGADT